MPFLPPNQQRQSTEGTNNNIQYEVYKPFEKMSTFIINICYFLNNKRVYYRLLLFFGRSTYLWFSSWDKIRSVILTCESKADSQLNL